MNQIEREQTAATTRNHSFPESEGIVGDAEIEKGFTHNEDEASHQQRVTNDFSQMKVCYEQC